LMVARDCHGKLAEAGKHV